MKKSFMKKSIMFLSLILVCVLMCGLVSTNTFVTTKNAHARSFEGEKIVVVGKGEIEVDPDAVKVSFGLRCRGESLQAGQTKMREIVENVTNKIKEYNKDTNVYINYSSSYPVYENGLLAYEFDCCMIAKSNDINNVNGLVDAVVNAGATSVHSVNYLLENKEDAYIKALIEAKQNAENKVKAIYENAILRGLKEEAVYNYCEGSRCEKIKIQAKVNACYEVNSPVINDSVKNSSLQKAFETSSNSTTAAQAKESTSLINNDSKKMEQDEKTKSNNTTNAKKDSIKNVENNDNQNKAEIKESKDASSQNINDTNSTLDKNDDATKNISSSNNEAVKKNDIEISSKQNNSKTNKVNKSNVETRKIIDADGNVVLEII